MKLRAKLSLLVALSTATTSLMVAAGVLLISYEAGIRNLDSRLSSMITSARQTKDDPVSVAVANGASEELTLVFVAGDGTQTVLQNSAGPLGSQHLQKKTLNLGYGERLIFAISSESVVQALATSIWLSVLLTALASLFVGWIVWWLMARDLKLVLALIERSKRIAAGQNAPAVKLKGSHELGELSDSLQEMVTRLEDSRNQMQTFLSDASHELRTPLSVIRGYLEILSKPKRLDAKQTSNAITQAQNSATRMQKLITDLLQLAKLGELPEITTEPLIFREILEPMVADLVAFQPKRNVEVRNSQKAAFSASSELMTQFFSNAFSNLRSHTPPDVKLLITITQSAVGVQIDIEDSGPGIPDLTDETAKTTFKRFDESHSAREDSSGLGLSIMAKIIDLHGGQMRLAPSKLGGLLVSAFLPAKNPHS